ncbi:MAG: hypothetical protein IH999_10100 [Proteobacteria bacterium]|nr:hypothetical protein [Pseudomonadota bacterium]
MVLPWTASKQNFKAAIQAAETDLQLAEKKIGETEFDKQTIEKCKTHLSNARAALNALPSRQILVLQNLLAIRQNLLLVLPIEETTAQWPGIARRLEQLKRRSHNVWDKDSFQNCINKFIKLKPNKRKPEIELSIRHNIREARRLIDSQRVVALWNALVMKRQSWIMGILALFLLLGIVVSISLECGFPAVCLKLPVDSQTVPIHSIIATVMAGGLGGVVSTFSKLREDADVASAPPFLRVELLRPIIGGTAGLFVWLASFAGAIQFTYPILYAAGFATGFSERLFYGQLQRLARMTDKQIGQVDEPGRDN